jgi:hypothetical protein
MKTVKELNAELELLKSDIERQYEVLSMVLIRESHSTDQYRECHN